MDINNFDIEKEKQDEREFDAKISRCSGLVEGAAVRKKDNKLVYASDITKNDGPFFCPKCLSDSVVRKCTEKVDHFAHLARQSPIIKKQHKELHNNCRDTLLEKLKQEFPDGKWEKEREIPANKAKGLNRIVPDISGRINNIPIAIEVQASAYTVNRIHNKLEEYEKRKVAVLYIIPLFEELGDKPFRPRLFEKYLHSLYYGRVYYWTKNLGCSLLPIHFSPTKRWIEATTWFDTETKEERTEGGFFLTYRTMKAPNNGQRIDITKDFLKVERKEFVPKNVKKTIPKSIIFKDQLKEWWEKNEYKELGKQMTINNDKSRLKFLEEYDYSDDYDDEDSYEE